MLNNFKAQNIYDLIVRNKMTKMVPYLHPHFFKWKIYIFIILRNILLSSCMYYSCAPLKWLVSRPLSLLLPSLMVGSVQWRGRKSSTQRPLETLSPWCILVECMTTPESLLSGYEPLSNAPFGKLKPIFYIFYISTYIYFW